MKMRKNWTMQHWRKQEEEKVSVDTHAIISLSPSHNLLAFPDLLIHKDFVKPSEQPAPYPWVDWFDHEPPPSPPILPPIAGSHPGNLLTWQERSAKQQTTSLSLPSPRKRKLTYPFHQQRVNQRKRKTTKLPTMYVHT